MRLRKITLTGMVLLVLAFTAIASATDNNSTDNATLDVNASGAPTGTLTAGNTTVDDTEDINATGEPTETLTVTPGDEIEDDEPSNGIFAPGHLLYRLKIAFEEMDETFTYNSTEKLGKQVSNARHRINEYRAALRRNDIEAADIALSEYGAKMNKVKNSMSKLPDKDSGLIKAQQMIRKHERILENLSIQNPDSKGLQKARNNSKELQDRFASKPGKKVDQDNGIEDRGTPKAEKTGASAKDSKPEKGNSRRSD